MARRSGNHNAAAATVAVVAGVALIAVAVAWPWMLGTHIATARGWSASSSERAVAGWLPETVYLVGALVVLVCWRAPRLRPKLLPSLTASVFALIATLVLTGVSIGHAPPVAASVAHPLPTTASDTPPATPDAQATPAAVTAADATTATPPAGSSSPTRRTAAPASRSGDTVTTAGAILPNASRTPGARNPDVTQADIQSTICVSGWTSTIRPPASYTTGIKEQQLGDGYAYRGDLSTSDYEEDHLISLELGGSPTSVLNLWPEPYQATDGARTKDQIENKLHSLVCAGQVSLATAQHAIATNWWTAYTAYIDQQTSAAAPRSSSYTPKTSAPAVVDPGNGATAQCHDGTYSYAAHHQGACSHHGGVAIFYK